MAGVTHVCTIDYVAKVLDEDLELLEAIVYNDDNLSYGSIVSDYTGPDPKHVLQLVLYSDLLTEIQGVPPVFAHVELGTGERATLRLADYAHYARAARARL